MQQVAIRLLLDHELAPAWSGAELKNNVQHQRKHGVWAARAGAGIDAEGITAATAPEPGDLEVWLPEKRVQGDEAVARKPICASPMAFSKLVKKSAVTLPAKRRAVNGKGGAGL